MTAGDTDSKTGGDEHIHTYGWCTQTQGGRGGSGGGSWHCAFHSSGECCARIRALSTACDSGGHSCVHSDHKQICRSAVTKRVLLMGGNENITTWLAASSTTRLLFFLGQCNTITIWFADWSLCTAHSQHQHTEKGITTLHSILEMQSFPLECFTQTDF